MRMQFQNQDVTRMKAVSCLFSQIPQEVPRFEVYAMPGFRKGRNARSAKMAKQGCPDPIKGSDPVTTQLWLGRHVHDPPSTGSPRAKVPWRWTVLINLKDKGVQMEKSQYMCIYLYMYIYMCIYICIMIYNDMALNWPSCDRLEVDGQSFPFTWRPGSEDVVLKVENFLEERVPNGVPPSAAKQKAALSSPDDN